MIVAAVYALAAAGGVLVYEALPFSLACNLLLADVAATAITFFFSALFKNASVYDPYWSVQPPVILFAFAVGRQLTATRLLLLLAVFLWGIRLTLNWAYTFHGLSHEDWRYAMLRERTGALFPLVNFFGIHLMPTLIVYGCTLPAVLAFVEGGEANLATLLFFCLSVAATVMQGAADVSMHRFRRRGTGGFIRSGLWRYSRHPNYLGEILMWWGVALAALSVLPDRPYLLLGALANTLLFLFVSIPLADRHQARKAGFEAYRHETRMLLPLPRRHKEKERIPS